MRKWFKQQKQYDNFSVSHIVLCVNFFFIWRQGNTYSLEKKLGWRVHGKTNAIISNVQVLSKDNNLIDRSLFNLSWISSKAYSHMWPMSILAEVPNNA